MSLALSELYSIALPEVQRVIAAASISASYSIVGTAFTDPLLTLIIVSTLDQAVQLSMDGINDWCPIPTGGTLVLDLKTNKIPLPPKAFYVKEIGNPTTGSLYITGLSCK